MRLLIISNRLPITVARKEGKLVITESSGGLVSGLSSYLDSLKNSRFPSKNNYIWVGWPGIEIKKEERTEHTSRSMEQYNAHPVFLNDDEMENFYQGFCNNTIWPLFHYFPSLAEYKENYWKDYKSVNEKFLEAILSILRPDDIVWIHDYHLMLLPQMLREKMPSLRIGFFLHIPFPTYEVFSIMPTLWRTKILQGLLGSDLVGFHTYSDTLYFIRCILRILGRESDLGEIEMNGRTIKADTFPMGIDYAKFNNALEDKEVKAESAVLKKSFHYEKVILSIDRLDYTKGIINRLAAYELFLQTNPGWYERIILLLKVIPSRIGVKRYRKIKKQIDELVGRVNGKYGNLGWTPILYQYGHIPFNPLVALYSLSDVILVTPLRDGMNLISKEYLACRKDSSGVLILSEMAGSSKELGEALVINPNNKEEIAEAIKEAISMPFQEQVKRTSVMQERLKRYDVVKWAEDFIQKIISASEISETSKINLLNEDLQKNLVLTFHNSARRLLLIGFEAEEDTESTMRILQSLAGNPNNDVVIVSSKDKKNLELMFQKSTVGMIAENGAWFRDKDGEWQMIAALNNSWKAQICPILEMFVDRLPGSLIEEKEFSLTYHHRKSDPELAAIRIRELLDHLFSFTANVDVNILKGPKVVEIRSSVINKGAAALYWIGKTEYDFILAAGEDWTDEELFKALPGNATTIRVGRDRGNASYFLPEYKSLISLFEKLAQS